MDKNVFIVKLLSGVLSIIAIITFNVAVSIGSDKAPGYREYVSSGNYFKCIIPEGWSVYTPSGFGLSEEEKKVYGVIFFGPYSESPVAPEISIHYYAPGNLLEKTMDKFIIRHSGPLVTEGKSYGEVRQIEFAGRKAKTFETISFRNLSGRVINPVKVSIYKKFITIPAKKGEGFYVLQISVPVELKDKYTETFEETSKSLLPEK